mgnify:CR=1 FL=1
MELVNTGRRVQNPLQHKGFRRFQSCRHRPQQTRKCQVRTRLEMLCSQKEPRVRIPNSPPKSPVNKRVCWTFLFCTFAQNRLKTMERTARFLERTRRFRTFWRIRTVKISSFRHHLKFRSTCCRNSPIRAVPFR